MQSEKYHNAKNRVNERVLRYFFKWSIILFHVIHLTGFDFLEQHGLGFFLPKIKFSNQFCFVFLKKDVITGCCKKGRNFICPMSFKIKKKDCEKVKSVDFTFVVCLCFFFRWKTLLGKKCRIFKQQFFPFSYQFS